ncbi:TPA: response regulator transcription factor [Streptococcus suis]|uniref:Response regulator n=1 Tax=Streptococcus suis TaxID=1307 RepID=A0A1D8H034_STRSU|nr:response regulator [Streptococcus suis]HEL1585329.1 response regulator transcription factor [Streptococcus suis]
MKILLIDDHILFAESLALTIHQYQPDIHIDILNNEDEFKSIFSKVIEYQVILLDINLDNKFSTDGFGIAQDILEEYPDSKIALLTGFDLPVYEYQAQKIGVKAFVPKNISSKRLIQILKDISYGKNYFPNQNYFIDELTEREKEILIHLGNGEKRKDIAKFLYISDRTLTNHIQNILEKLEVDSTLKAVIKAQKLGYIK